MDRFVTVLNFQACHARISTSSALLGLPELQYGILPGLGGLLDFHRSTRVVDSLNHLNLYFFLNWALLLLRGSSFSILEAIAQIINFFL